uniref:Uncharacterized protein n=1 Tax=Rousettus aegyptiacus TaxID=9407 RepID=A0A7J8BES2_ROUAE|nr:hypothetical protein HJG63_009846 [Rousettus aegyptiacus]
MAITASFPMCSQACICLRAHSRLHWQPRSPRLSGSGVCHCIGFQRPGPHLPLYLDPLIKAKTLIDFILSLSSIQSFSPDTGPNFYSIISSEHSLAALSSLPLPPASATSPKPLVSCVKIGEAGEKRSLGGDKALYDDIAFICGQGSK